MINSSMIKENIQKKIYRELEKVLSLFYHELLTDENWDKIVLTISSRFDYLLRDKDILIYHIICNNVGSDFILEYDISFSEGWFLYCHLRRGHLMIKFVPKEF